MASLTPCGIFPFPLDLASAAFHAEAMLFLHVSDLHLGKTLCGYDLFDDQAYMLGQLLGLTEKVRPDALLVAGDVYDKPVPPVEAIRLFDGFLMDVRKVCPGIRIVVIPGNHDSAGRLSFGATLLADTGLVIRTTVRSEPAAVIEKGGERAALWALPFLSQAKALWPESATAAQDETSVQDAPSLSGPASPSDAGAASIGWQETLARRAMSRIRPNLDPESLNLLVCHCFASGALVGDSEVMMVGAAERIACAVFDGFDYVALGHLHSRQSPCPGVWYSGSPMAYSLQDAERERDAGHGALIVRLEKGTTVPHVDFAPFEPKRRIRKIHADFASLVANPPEPERRDDYVDITLCDPEPVLDPEGQLRNLYPRNLGIRQRALEREYAGSLGPDGQALRSRLRGTGSREELAREDFIGFFREMRGESPDEATLALFDSLVREATDASD